MTNDVLRELETWLSEQVEYYASAMTKDCNEVADKYARWADALSALLREREWRPIETAPKDGKYVLVAHSDGGVCEGRFVRNDGWQGWAARSMYPAKPGVTITHWMPLPSIPVE